MGLEIEADLHLGASLDSLAQTQKQQAATMRMIQEALDNTPHYQPIAKSATVAASGPTIFGCGHPTRGRMWEIRRLTVGGTNKAGTAYFFIQPMKPPATFTKTHITGLYLVDTTQGLWPNRALYGTGELVVQPETELWCVVTTGTATTVVTVGGSALDYEFAAYRANIQL